MGMPWHPLRVERAEPILPTRKKHLMAVATDYDAPRRNQAEETDDDSLEALKARRTDPQSGTIDVDETDLNEALELPGADLSYLSEDELTVRVLPKQADEFTCSRCFLVHHRSRKAHEKSGKGICRDCAA
jgi:hypothetical protein